MAMGGRTFRNCGASTNCTGILRRQVTCFHAMSELSIHKKHKNNDDALTTPRSDIPHLCIKKTFLNIITFQHVPRKYISTHVYIVVEGRLGLYILSKSKI